MGTFRRFAEWLENRWVAPAYSGWLLLGLSIFFFMAATNTLSGWLYVISGISAALLAIAVILPERTLRSIQMQRHPIAPVSVGEPLTIELTLENLTPQAKTLIQVQDLVPFVLGKPVTTAIEGIAPKGVYRWVYTHPTEQRGVYRWHTVHLRTANPLGLFWCRRSHEAKALAIVYPTVLPLAQCPLVDEMGRTTSLQLNHDRRAQAASEGLTRSLRPYRWGDPTRLIHWRTSARYGELRVRELEIFTSGQELILCLDSASAWRTPSDTTAFPETFEQAVIAAASLYFYAYHRHLSVKVWTAATGLVQGSQQVLEALAATQAEEESLDRLPTTPLVWLTQNPASLETLPMGSRWILWRGAELNSPNGADSLHSHHPGLVVAPEQPLQLQLQSLPRRE